MHFDRRFGLRAPSWSLFGLRGSGAPQLVVLAALAISSCAPPDAEDESLDDSESFVTVVTSRHAVVSLFSAKALTFEAEAVENGLFARQQPLRGSKAQVFDLRQAGPDTVTLVSTQNGKCLDLLGFDGRDAARVGQWDCNGKKNQAWRIVRRGGAVELRSAWNGKCLDVLGYHEEDGAVIGVWTCKGAANQLWTLDEQRGVDPGQLVGTQTFGPLYHFEPKDPILESAGEIERMGSRMIKLAVSDKPEFRSILGMSFTHYFLWFRSASPFYDGLSDAERRDEYEATYAFTKKLLQEYSGSGKTFFLGHWEGDWYLLRNFDATVDPPAAAISGMIEWLNIRQQAIDDAKRNFPHHDVSVYQYTEVNRVVDAMRGGHTRLVNAVLPQTNVDYVSYSSYDLQGESPAGIHATLDYVQSKLRPKREIPGKRVFIGEFGVPAAAVGYDSAEHERRNREIIEKYLAWGAPFVLYWQLFNNEEEDGKQVGYWLINDKNQKQQLYYTLQGLYAELRSFKVNFEQQNGRPALDGELRAHAIAWLKGR